MRFVILSVLLAGMAHAVEPSVFSSYLLTVERSKEAPATVLAAAEEYVSKGRALNGSGLVFEARLRAIESPSEADAIAAALDADLKRLEERRAELLADSLRRLRNSLGEAGFAAFERSVDTWHTALLSAPRPVAAKR